MPSFAECLWADTRQTTNGRRPSQWPTHVPATWLNFDESLLFAVRVRLLSVDARHTLFLPCAVYLPSVSSGTHGKHGVCRVPKKLLSANFAAHNKFQFSGSGITYKKINNSIELLKLIRTSSRAGPIEQGARPGLQTTSI